MNNTSDLIHNFNLSNVLIVGDIMLDSFVYGAVERISPEGPIPVLAVQNEKEMLGGAGNVLSNVLALGGGCDLISTIGDDGTGQKIRSLIEERGASASSLIVDASRPTILKTRYIAQNQQLLRIDHERAAPIAVNIQEKIIVKATEQIKNKKILILSDYGKGVLTSDLIKALIQLARDNNVTVIVDPKGKEFSKYTGAHIITPNKKELSEGTQNAPTTLNEDIECAAKEVIEKYNIETVIATRSEDGMSVIDKEKSVHIPTVAREVYDVSGAGDTVVATIAAALGAGAGIVQAVEIANIAGGLVVAKMGTAVVTQDELQDALQNNNEQKASECSFIAPILQWEAARAQIEQWQAQGVRVGMTGGCFDIIHYGHVHYFANARERCDKLIVALNSDASVQILKGSTRPVNDEKARAAVIAALGACDMVVFFGAQTEGEDNTPYEVLSVLKPDVFFKGGDYTVNQLPESEAVLAYGGQVDIMPLYDGYSTSNIINKSASH